jgi:hypothetical protein
VIACFASLALIGVLTGSASGVSLPLRTVPPTPAQRVAILKAFGSRGAPARCLRVGLAASDHAYATVHFRPVAGCGRWGFNGVNVVHHRRAGGWKVSFEGSSYSCPRPRIPRQVQRDLGICA